MAKKAHFLAILAASLPLAPAVAAAPPKGPKFLDVNAFMEMETLSDAQISPEGNLAGRKMDCLLGP